MPRSASEVGSGIVGATCEIVSVSAVTTALVPVVIVSSTVRSVTGEKTAVSGQVEVDGLTVLVQLKLIDAGVVDPVRVALAAVPVTLALSVKSFCRSLIKKPCAKAGSISAV